jgi:adenine specific DNA methyltransferase (putative type II)
MNKIEIKNQDCFEFLKDIPNNSVDLILIDPPYNISRDTNFAKGQKSNRDVNRFRMSMDFGEWDKTEISFDLLLRECYRVLKKSGTIIYFYDIWKITNLKKNLEDNKFKQIRLIQWIKTNPVPINSKINLTNAIEFAIVGVKINKPTFNSYYDNGIYSFPIYHNKNRFHPTQKSIKLIESLILKYTNENDLVLDCFLGSGTTAIACHNLKRNFIGCELSKEYYNKILDRLK